LSYSCSPARLFSQRRRGRTVPTGSERTDTFNIEGVQRGDTLLKGDTLQNDTIQLQPAGKKKQPLDAPVIYEATDSIVFTQNGIANLYGDGKVNYQKIELAAEVIHTLLSIITSHIPLALLTDYITDQPLFTLKIAVPFFFFPFSSSYSSGFIMPSYMDDSTRGFGLTDGGYYFAISDKMDLKLRGDIFTKGSWALNAETNYNVRYKFSGLFQASYQVTKTGDKGLDDYTVAKDFKVVWSHRQDPKASPNSSFSASVNFSSSSYERTNIGNMYNAQAMTQNTKTSSISYSRNFPDQKLSIAATGNIAQSMKDSSIAVTLPDLNITLSTIFPFKRKNAVGNEKWYEKISLRYSGRLSNSITTKDDLLFKSNLVKDWKNGMKHEIPISATFTFVQVLQCNSIGELYGALVYT